MKCNKCSRVMRSQGMLKADYPGTVASGARGLCSSCYARQLKLESPVDRVVTTKAVEHNPDIADIPCVLVRVNLTPATYKALRLAKADIPSLLSRAADHIVKGMDNA